MSLSIISYTGSKRLDIKYFESYIPKNIKTIVEPFGGSGYLSLYLFNKNNKTKCHVNDIDSALIHFFKTLKRYTKRVIDGYNSLIHNYPSKKKYEALIDKYMSGKGTSIQKAVLFLFYNKFYAIRKGLYPTGREFKPIVREDHEVFFDWLKVTTFTNYDYEFILRKYKNQKSVFVFLDPPYFSSFNSDYISYKVKTEKDHEIIDNTKMFIDIYDYMDEAKSKSMLIINKNHITTYIYKPFIVDEYDKIYQMTKKRTKHLIVCNYHV